MAGRRGEVVPGTAGEVLARQAAGAGVVDPRVLSAVRTVPRWRFVPARFAAQAFLDEPFPIGCGQTTSQPSLVARMVEALALAGTDRVLEIGTGLGYEAALMASLVRSVDTIELVPELAAEARRRLAAAGVPNVEVHRGDGHRGLPELAPFDAIVAAATTSVIPPAFCEQLAEGRRLVLPVRDAWSESVRVYERRDSALHLAGQLGAVRFVPFVTPPA